ncbi:MAG: hypothetical protein KGI46_05165, partial [Alphaproteobacteria bacterium]|nr:hypothetical protein [Alphaproteobacteria bacterium]
DAYGLLEWYPNAKPEKTEGESKGISAKSKRGRPPKSSKGAEPEKTPPEKKAAADTDEAPAA